MSVMPDPSVAYIGVPKRFPVNLAPGSTFYTGVCAASLASYASHCWPSEGLALIGLQPHLQTHPMDLVAHMLRVADPSFVHAMLDGQLLMPRLPPFPVD